MTAADVLDRAADLIARDGWVRGWFGSPDSGWCAGGAIFEAGYSSGCVPDDAWRAVAHDIGRPVHQWNDADDRTQTEVLAALRWTAARLRQVQS